MLIIHVCRFMKDAAVSRPQCKRTVDGLPDHNLFKPAGVPGSRLEEVLLTVDEYEALRLADLEGLYHDEAADLMNVSRQTFGRIIQSARQKTASALVEGKALRIEGGAVYMNEKRKFRCNTCGHEWEVPFGTGRPSSCPQCQGIDFYRSDDLRGPRAGKHAPGGAGCRRPRSAG
jgi:predicted DNA-binding protein (UPF0251 family)